MKKLSIILSFLICGITAFSQYPINLTPLGSDSALSRFKGAVKGRLINFPFADTTSANLQRIKYYDGAQLYTNTGGARFWLRDSALNKWVEITTGASSVITIITDSSINICSFVNNATSVCDTFVTNNINAIANVEIINDSTLLVCDIEALCDTLHIPPRNFFGISANNGLTMSSPTNVQLGGQLVQNTTVDTRFQIMTFAGKTIYDYPLRVNQNANFANSTAMQSWKNIGGISTEIDFNNEVRLGVNYTGAVYPVTPTNFAGYMGDKIGYWIGANATGNGSFGLRTDNSSSKLNGIFFHTLDTASTDQITFFGKHPPNANYIGALGVGSLGLKPYRIMTLKDNLDMALYGYPNTRNDAPTSRAFYADASGNVKYGPISAGSTVNIFNDTTIIICSQGTNLCDTTTINNVGNLQTVTILNDSTIIVCGPSLCDTLVVPQADFNTGITANNGLTMNTPTNVQLGGTLIKNTIVGTDAFSLTVEGSMASANGLGKVIINNSGTANALNVNANGSSGVGLYATSANSSAILAVSTGTSAISAQNSSSSATASYLANPTSTNTVQGILAFTRQTSGTAANGIGAGITVNIEMNNGSAFSAAAINFIATDVIPATRSSQIDFIGNNNNTVQTQLSLLSTGKIQATNYGIGTFTGTATRGLAVDASGNIIETAISASGLVYTASNGLTMTSNNVVLGGTLTGNTTINTASNTLSINTATDAINPLTVNSTTGTALLIESTGSNAIYATGLVGINANSSANSAITATGSSGATPIKAIGDGGTNIYMQSTYASTNTTETMLQVVRSSSGTAANSIANRIKLDIQTTNGTSQEANTIVSKWTTATTASRVSEFSITGVNAAVTATLFTLAGSGAARLNIYGTGGFTGTSAFCLAVDASGNIIEVACAGPGGGSVNSVAGTANRITSTGGTDPILDISAAYVGQNTITIIGTIGTGVWQGTAVGPTFGGTGLTSYTQGDLPYASAANTLSKLAIGTALQVLRVNAGATALEWATPGTGGTVTLVSIGNLSPLFTASVATATTTPAISFALSNAAANTWYGNNTSGSTTPSFNTFGTGVNTWITTPSSANFAAAITNEVGTGNVILQTNTTLITPNIGTPSAGILTNATGLPVSTGISGLATGIAAFLATPTSANFASAVTNETGTAGFVVLSISPTLTTPVLGIATATSINKVILTTPATTATLTILNNKVFTVNKTITLDGTDNQTYTFPTTNATIARTDAANTFTGVQTFNGNVTLNNTLFSGNSITTNSQSGTTYTVLSTDNGDVIDFTSASAVTVTVPSGLPTGFNCTIRQLAAGQITLSASGTTLRNFSNETKTGGLWAVINLMWISANVYTISGETGP